MTKKIAVIIAGCGFLDGAEINETVLSLLHLEKAGVEFSCFAPDIDQHHVLHHLSMQEQSEKRNVLQEAARIVRGQISALDKLDPEHFDALVVPGGYGVVKNLSDFAFKGSNCQVLPQVLEIIKAFHAQAKPLGLMCIAPVLAASVVSAGVELTIGNDVEIAAMLQTMGAKHINTDVSQIHIDKKHKIVTTPAYMLATSIAQAELGIEKLIRAVVELAR